MAEGFFRSKKGFTVVQNGITKDVTISLKAKGLYLVIQSYITMPNKKWTKEDFLRLTKEGRKAFDSAWNELKNSGYLKVHFMPDNGKWRTEYELLDEADLGAHTLYHNKAGDITSDNVSRAQKKAFLNASNDNHTTSVQIEKNTVEAGKDRKYAFDSETDSRYPLFGSNAKMEDDRYPPFGSNANGSNGKGYNAEGNNGYGLYGKGGNNNKDSFIKNNINTYRAAPNLNPNPEPLLVKYPMDYLENLFGANDMIQMGVASDEVELVMEILFDTINTTKKTIWVNREEKAAEVVRSRLLKLSSFDIKYAIEQYSKQTGEIKYQKAYMLSILYDAKGQSSLDFTNRVQHDFYGGD